MRKRLSQQNLTWFFRNPTNFVRQFVTLDETRVHHYTPEKKQQSKLWVEAGGSASKKAKSIAMVIGYLKKGKYYSKLLDHLDAKIRAKRPGLRTKKIIFYKNKAAADKSALALGKLRDVRYEFLCHCRSSADLALSDFHLFSNSTKFVSGKRFASIEEVERAVDEYFHTLPDSHFRTGILMLEKR